MMLRNIILSICCWDEIVFLNTKNSADKHASHDDYQKICEEQGSLDKY